MVPVALVVGLVIGMAAVTVGRSKRRVLAIVALAASLAWGVAVGVNDGSLATFAAGTGLALANIVAAALFGVLLWTVLPGV